MYNFNLLIIRSLSFYTNLHVLSKSSPPLGSTVDIVVYRHARRMEAEDGVTETHYMLCKRYIDCNRAVLTLN